MSDQIHQYLSACARASTDDETQARTLVRSFRATLTSGSYVLEGVDEADNLGITTKSTRGDKTEGVSFDSVVSAMSLCVALDLYPAPASSPLTPPQIRGGALAFSPNHRGWARLLQRAGIRVQPIVCHRNDEVNLTGWTVDIEREPGLRVSQPNDLQGVALYAFERGTAEPIVQHWVPADTITKRLGKSRGGAGSEWFAEFAAAAAIRDAIARGILAVDSAQVDAAMSTNRDDETPTEPTHTPKPARRPADIPRPSGEEIPEALREPEEEPEKPAPAEPDALGKLMRSHDVSVDAFDAWRVAENRPPLADMTPDQRDGLAKWLSGRLDIIAKIHAAADKGRT